MAHWNGGVQEESNRPAQDDRARLAQDDRCDNHPESPGRFLDYPIDLGTYHPLAFLCPFLTIENLNPIGALVLAVDAYP